MSRRLRFATLVLGLLVVGAVFGYFAIRRDLLGMSVGVLILGAPLFLIAVLVGVRQVRREAREDWNAPEPDES